MATAETNSYEAGTTGSATRGTGSGVIDRVRERAAAQISTQKDKAMDGLGSVVQSVRQSTQQLREQQHGTLADYVERAADQVDRLAHQLRNKDVGELFEQAQRLARRQPALFIGSAFALGLIGARFLKSSSPSDRNHYDRGYGYGRGTQRTESGRTWRETTAPADVGSTGYTGATGTTGTASTTGFTGTASTTGTTGTAGTSTSASQPSGTSGATGRSRRTTPESESY